MITPNPAPVIVRQPTVRAMLSLSPSGFSKLKKRDPSFPRPIKEEETRQAAVYYVLAEVEAWINAKMAARNGEAA